jgi:PAS domain S-box-containing protein
MNTSSDIPSTTATSAVARVLITALLENAPDLIYFKDKDSKFIAVSRSKAARHGLTPEAMIGMSDADFFAEEFAQWARVDEESIMATGEPIVGKLERTVWRDGREGWAQATKMPLRDNTGEIIGTFGLTRDVTATHEVQLQLEKAQRSLLDTSRLAGMAEVATGVLHNVGNVLTSLNVSANMIATSLRQSKAESLGKLAALVQEHRENLGSFMRDDPKGRRVPEFLESLGQHMVAERDRLSREIASLQENIDHIKDIVTMQQAYATMVGVVESLDVSLLVEDALRMNAGALVRHSVSLVREFHPTPPVRVERAKVLQILVNLIRNAKYAADDGGRADKIITVRIAPGEADRVKIIVQDNGIGIAPENLPKIFQHGFTTRADGHGFGLSSAAAAAKDLKATLTVASQGLGCGATFTLDLPLDASRVPDTD